MPYKTFFNLSTKKQERIMKAATREFGKRGFQKASIAMIADRAQVAKGSMYQYFENKRELYRYIFDFAVEKKLNYIAKILVRTSDDSFIEVLRKMFIGAFKYARNNPELYQIYHNMIINNSGEIKKRKRIKIIEKGSKHYQNLIKKGIKRGELRNDLSIEIAGFIVYRFLEDFGEYVTQGKKEPGEDTITKYVNEIMKIIINGLKNTEGEQL